MADQLTADADADAPAKGQVLLALERVAALLEAGDADGALRELWSSGYLVSVARWLSGRWPRLSRDLCEEAVAEAVASLHRAALEGRPVGRPGGWVRKTADRLCGDEQERQDALRSDDIVDEQTLLDAHGRWSDPGGGEQRDRRRAAALRFARGLLPQLGQRNVQRVMGYLFDAVERGQPDVPSLEIAGALGLSDDVVRQSLSRGFKRLGRLAAEQGLDVDASALLDDPDFDTDPDPDPEEDA